MSKTYQNFIDIVGAKQHNLKNINIKIPKNKLIVITGLSGSGKSSLAFDTIYAEGQRRYIESLSTYARQFLNVQTKPDLESITGLSPAIAIDQKTIGKNPRSTVGTITEIYDYLRLLFARIGVPYSPVTNKPLQSQTPESMVEDIMKIPHGAKILISAPIIKESKGEHKRELIKIKKRGYTKIKVDGTVYDINNNLPALNKSLRHNIDILIGTFTIDGNLREKILASIAEVLFLSNGLVFIEIINLPDKIEKFSLRGQEYRKGDHIRFSEKFTCPESGLIIEKIEPRLFSFNNPFGACKKCDGLGTELQFNKDLIILDKKLSIREGAINPWKSDSKAKYYIKMIEKIGQESGFNIDTPYYKYPEEVKNIILYGYNKTVEIEHEDNYKTIHAKVVFEGVLKILKDRYAKNKYEMIRDELSKYQSLTTCQECCGYRLNQQALSIKIADKHIGQISEMSISKAIEFFNELPVKLNKMQQTISEKIIIELKDRLTFLRNVGLEYLTLSRRSGTLSGGESQRIRLATQIGTGLSGVLYVLDEPSIGLHQADNKKLIQTMKNLRDLGNTVIVVEHDEETMLAADYLIDIGPGAGIHGGEIVSQGIPEKVMNDPNSITGLYLCGKKAVPVPPERRSVNPKKIITIKNARANNLKNLDVTFPLGVFCSVTGLSGSGKSTLLLNTLYRALSKILNGAKVIPGAYDKLEGISNVDKIIQIDQSPIGRTPRSNPCTYVGAFTHIRDLYASLKESKERNYKLNRFSFNVKGGRCENCQGDGMMKIEMHFLPDVYVKCPVCKGKRYNMETLEIIYKGQNIADVLEMTVEEGAKFFKDMPFIYDKLKSLKEVGLGYIKLGQSATTLSGGEAQRIKLAKELSKKETGNTVYILDEPTTGLHADDIKKLLHVLHKLVEQGNTVMVIEHNLDVIKTSDWVIDVGPCGGEKGGYIVAEGTPEIIAQNSDSLTGQFLKKVLEKYKNNKINQN
jgi:excinuclease ABC subunit A